MKLVIHQWYLIWNALKLGLYSEISFLHSSMERALTNVSDIGLTPIVGPSLRFNPVCSMFVIVCNTFRWILTTWIFKSKHKMIIKINKYDNN